jgi:uncharacterized protein YndB with AHSA1/START domain
VESRAKLTLPSDREILVEREFRAPKALLFEAWSRPEFIAQWYGCAGMEMTSCDVDFREGGTWRWVLTDAATGTAHTYSGDYREIVRPERLVFVERYEPIPGSDHLVTVSLAERGGVTALTMLLSYESVHHRDGHLQAGMESGLQESLHRMEQVARGMIALAS